MELEEEIKLAAPDPTVLESALADPMIRAAADGADPSSARRFVATYFDTSDRTLLKQRLAFRIRREGAAWVAGLKGNAAPQGMVARRREMEVDLDGPLVTLLELPEGPLREKMAALIGLSASLEPLLINDFTRRTLNLEGDGWRAEMAADLGWAEAGGKRAAIHEIELERISGSLDALMGFAQRLKERHNLFFPDDSKFTLGLKLLGLSEKDFQA